MASTAGVSGVLAIWAVVVAVVARGNGEPVAGSVSRAARTSAGVGSSHVASWSAASGVGTGDTLGSVLDADVLGECQTGMSSAAAGAATAWDVGLTACCGAAVPLGGLAVG